MAYTTPVLAFIMDLEAAALALGEAKDYFYYESAYDTCERASDLSKLMGVNIQYFMMEDSDYIEFGIEVERGFTIYLNAKQLAKATKKLADLKAANPHPLVQSMELAVVSQFC